MRLFSAKNLLKRHLENSLKGDTRLSEGDRLLSSSTLEPLPNLVECLTDYLRCRQFLEFESVFAAQIKHLRAWQAQRVRKTHQACLNHPLQRQAAEFVLIHAYEQLDMVSLAPQLKRLVRYAERLFPQPLLRIAELAFTVNLLTAQMDQAIAQEIFEQMQLVEINETDYIRAFLNVGGVAMRHQQLSLIVDLVSHLDLQARNKGVLIAFKLAKAPAYAAGMGALYSFLEKGLEALRSSPNVVEIVRQITDVEFMLNDTIADGKADSLLKQA